MFDLGLSQLGVFFFAAMVPILLLFLASMRTSIPVSSAAFFIVIALILEGAQLLEYPRLPLQKASGAFCILVGILLWYSALAVMLAEEGLKIVSTRMRPSGLPVARDEKGHHFLTSLAGFAFALHTLVQLPVFPLPRVD